MKCYGLCTNEAEFYNEEVDCYLCYSCHNKVYTIKNEGLWASIKKSFHHEWNKD